MQIEIKFSSNVENALKEKAGLIPRRINQFIWDVGTSVKNALNQSAPRCRTSHLSASHKIWPMGALRFNVGPDERIAPYAKHVIKGRLAIQARRAKALRIQFCDGKVIYRKKAKASKPNDYRRKALLMSSPERYRIENTFAQWIVKI
jgi:hypothetical protein